MTTYILKDTYEQLIERPLTQKILYIMKNSKQEEFTKREILESGIKRYQKNFKSDPKGHTVLRYLKTMALYGLVEEIKVGNGKPSYWKINEISPKLDFQVTVKDHINRLKDFSVESRRDDQEQPFSFDSIHESGITVYDISGHKYIQEGSLEEKLLNICLGDFKDAMVRLTSLQSRILTKQMNKQSDKILNSSYSLIDRYLAMVYIVSLTTAYSYNFIFGEANDKGRPISFKWFETNDAGENIFPFVVKPDIELLNVFCNILCTSDRKKVWNTLNGYVMDEKICHDLIILHDTYNGIFFPMIRTTVVCETDINTYSKKMDKVMKKEELSFYENIRNFMKHYSI